MRKSLLVIFLAALVMAAFSSEAQQSLGDVAGSIKLNRPAGEAVVIDRNAIGQARKTSVPASGVDLLSEAVDDCLVETRALHDLFNETRDGLSFYRDEWRSRVASVGQQLESARFKLESVVPDGRYVESYEKAQQGADTALSAHDIMRSAIASDRPVFSQGRTVCEQAVRMLEEAQTEIGAAARRDAAESTPAMINPIDADRIISSTCGRQYATGSQGYGDCVVRERSALDVMRGRTGPSAGLDVESFNMIRNACRFEWPNSFVSQDRCERNRIAAQKSR